MVIPHVGHRDTRKEVPLRWRPKNSPHGPPVERGVVSPDIEVVQVAHVDKNVRIGRGDLPEHPAAGTRVCTRCKCQGDRAPAQWRCAEGAAGSGGPGAGRYRSTRAHGAIVVTGCGGQALHLHPCHWNLLPSPRREGLGGRRGRREVGLQGQHKYEALLALCEDAEGCRGGGDAPTPHPLGMARSRSALHSLSEGAGPPALEQ
mmetsp:Transcript_62474/g.197944  ORF Transcript_62474/g.197944 Transcript_62474/m.197944 type:complete len:203 (-) Transcript_62474:76-684(-)